MASNHEERIKAADEKLAKLKEEAAKIAATKKALQEKVRALENNRKRRIETTVKVLLGAAALKLVKNDPALLTRLIGQLNERDSARVSDAFAALTKP